MALEKCCFCCRLETGGTILGFLAAGLALISFILNVTSLSYPSGYTHYDELLHPIFGLFTGLSLIDLAAAVMLIIGIAKVPSATFFNQKTSIITTISIFFFAAKSQFISALANFAQRFTYPIVTHCNLPICYIVSVR